MTVPISIKYILAGQLKFMGQQGFEVLSLSAGGAETKDIVQREECRHIVIPFTRKISPLADLLSLIKLVIVFVQWKPLIVHTQTPKAGLLGMIAAWIARVPIRVHTVAGMPFMEAKGIRRSLLSASERITYRCAHRVYTNSQALKEFLVTSFGVDSRRLGMIGNGSSNGIDTKRYSRSDELLARGRTLRSANNISADDLVFCFVGRLVRDKGVQELVDAFVLLREQVPSAKLILLGHFEDDIDPLSERTKREILENKSIIAPGFRNEVNEYMAASDVFVFPSYREGFPNVVLQACAMELPSIVTNIGGSNEIIRHLENGLVINAKDVNNLQMAMALLATDPDLRKRLSKNARAAVVEQFDQALYWKAMALEYNRLIDQRVSGH